VEAAGRSGRRSRRAARSAGWPGNMRASFLQGLQDGRRATPEMGREALGRPVAREDSDREAGGEVAARGRRKAVGLRLLPPSPALLEWRPG